MAVVIPRPETAVAWAKEKSNFVHLSYIGVQGTYEEICKNNEFKLDVLRDLEKINKEAKVTNINNLNSVIHWKLLRMHTCHQISLQ